MAQIDCAEAAAIGPDLGLPSRGLLHFFYNLDEQPRGGSPEELSEARILFDPDPRDLPVAALPPNLDPEEGLLPAIGLAFELNRPGYPGDRLS